MAKWKCLQRFTTDKICYTEATTMKEAIKNFEFADDFIEEDGPQVEKFKMIGKPVKLPISWANEAIKKESDESLADRLKSMSSLGETQGRSFALKEAAKRLKNKNYK